MLINQHEKDNSWVSNQMNAHLKDQTHQVFRHLEDGTCCLGNAPSALKFPKRFVKNKWGLY